VSKFSEGDMVVLISGSMRMAVERVEDETVHVVWCHEGKVGRDSFSEKLLNKWEIREDRPQHGGGPRGGRDDRQGGGGHRGRDRDDRGGGGGHRGGGGRDRDRDDRGGGDRERGKTGWDGRPRDKKFFRKDD
jgi:uncharacterized membrane protein YgcG